MHHVDEGDEPHPFGGAESLEQRQVRREHLRESARQRLIGRVADDMEGQDRVRLRVRRLLRQRVFLRQSLLRRLHDAAADLGIAEEFRLQAVRDVLFPPHGTIHVSALKPNGEMSGMTTTSGLAWKIAGRCGDSPIIGAGSYTDQDVGSAGATGSGEENIRVCGAHSIVENMRHGMSPKEAGLDVLTDGEYRRYFFMDDLCQAFDGWHLTGAAEDGAWHGGDTGSTSIIPVAARRLGQSRRLTGDEAALLPAAVEAEAAPELLVFRSAAGCTTGGA